MLRRIALSVSLAMPEMVLADGMVAAEGSGVAVSSTAAGVPVVAIATPSSAGLSHNRFNDYNVGTAGAVLNNATQPGSSQLAGPLPANPQLHGAAARVILNEVISSHPSLLLGQQEVFGQAADFVLANPNGITCNGCGFINTPRASLLVGGVQLDQGKLQSMLPGKGLAQLHVGPGGVSQSQVLDLISPQVDARGALVAVSGLNVVLGHAPLDYASRLPAGRSRTVGAPALDSALLGGMHAGRISIVSTDDGAGVNLSGRILGEAQVSVDTLGKLDLEGAQIKGEHILLSADQVSAHARSASTTNQTAEHGESWFIWKTGAEDTIHQVTNTNIERSRLEGKQVRIKAHGEIGLSATDIVARNIRLQARDILLAGEAEQDRTSADYAGWKNSWQRRQYTETDRVLQSGSALDARNNLSLVARRDIQLQGAQIKAGHDVQFIAGQDLRVSGLLERDRRVDRGSRYLEGDGLASGSWNKVDDQQWIKATRLDAGHVMAISATNDLSLQAAKLQSGGDIAMRAGHRIDVLTQSVSQDQSQRDQSSRWGGLAGSDRVTDLQSRQQNVASQVTADGVLVLQSEQDIQIVGSQLNGAQGAQALAHHGRVAIEHATDLTQSMIDARSGGAFDIPVYQKTGQGSSQLVQGGQLRSQTNLEVVSGGDIDVLGSQLAASQKLELQAGGDLRLRAAEQKQHQQQQQRRLEVDAQAGADPSQSGTYRLGLGLTLRQQSQEQDQTTAVGASVTGGSVRAAAQRQVLLRGSRVSADNGSLALSGENLSFETAAQAQNTRETQGHTSAGVYLSASRKQLRLGGNTSGLREQSERGSAQPQGSRLQASADLTVSARGGAIHSEAAEFQSGGALSLQAGTIENRAVHSQVSERQQRSSWDADLGANADPGVLLKPLEKVVDKLKSGQFSEAQADAEQIKSAVRQGIEQLRQGDWAGLKQLAQTVGMPTVGGSLALDLQHQQSDSMQQQARGSDFSGQQVQVRSGGVLNDQGSRYQATVGVVGIQAETQQFSAAEQRSERNARDLRLKLALQGETSTGHDLALKGAISGKGRDQHQSGVQVVTGEIVAQNGIGIDLQQQGGYQATRLDAGQGALRINSGGELALTSAAQQQDQREGKLDASLALELNLRPNAAKAHDIGGAGKLDWDGGLQRANSRTAAVAQLSGRGGVSLQAGGHLRLHGSQLGSSAEPVGRVVLDAGKDLEIQSTPQSSRQNAWSSSGELAAEARLSGLPGARAAFKLDQSQAEADGSRSAQVDAGQLVLNSRGGTRIVGAELQAETVSGSVRGDLQLESARQVERSQRTLVDLGVSTPDIHKMLSGDGMGLHGKMQHDRYAQDAVSQPSQLTARQMLDLPVGGRTTIRGARLTAGKETRPNGGKVVLHTAGGERSSSQWRGDFSGTPATVATQVIKDALAGKPPLGFEHHQQSEDRSQSGAYGQP